MSNVTLEFTWMSSLPVFTACFENGTPGGKKLARDELSRMARVTDAAVKCQRCDNNDSRRWLGMNRYQQNVLRKKWADVQDKLREALNAA
ncbi:hypothetical protein [Yoonia sp. R2-816]|uniref:hypothetical protein n=1 Tax=Yoonia sp. R2-816 TaxID=3342638 RepID=UPI00372D5185